MATKGGKRPPLKADKRYPTARKKPAAKKKPVSSKSRSKRKTTRKPARRGGIIGFFLGILRWVWRLFFGVMWRGTLVVGLITAMGVLYYAATLPAFTELVDGRVRGSVIMEDRYGDRYAWRGDQFGGMVTTETVSVHLHNAVVATEDKRFYWHLGVSPRGIASAIRINLAAGRGPLSGNGGSTITQQTAKLLCLGRPFDPAQWENEADYESDCRRTTLWRKVTEMVFSMAMEAKYSKSEILTIYLNRSYLGAGSRGFEAAAQRYFGHSASEVTPAEAAMLAGLLKAPSSYAPTSNLERSQNRAGVVIDLMEAQGYLSASAAQEARDNPATLSPAARARAGGYFADWVMGQGPEFLTRTTTEDVVVRTTLDQKIQTAAEEALTYVFENDVRAESEAQAAIIVMSADGAVRAMVGGRDLQVSGAFNRATQALRQPGSAFKPFVYGAALDMGMGPYDLIDDSPLTIHTAGSGDWTPRNYDHEFKGMITMTQALIESRNIPAVRLAQFAGLDNVRAVASQFGIRSDLADGPAVALGVSESTLIEMAGAYAGILNGGSAVTPYGLTELTLLGDDEPLMSSAGGIGERVITRESAEALVWMMHRVIEEGSGQRARIPGRQVAGKTGTTQAARDAWFIGITGDYVAAVWMGYDDNSPLTGVTGGGLPAEIWRQTMERILVDTVPSPLPMSVPAQPTSDLTEDVADQILQDVISNILNGQ